MKRPPKSVAMDSDPYALFEAPKIAIKHRRLFQDYQHLHNESEAVKEELLLAKRKKSTLLAEVRFLRHRYEFLRHQSLNSQPKHGLEPPRNVEIRPPNAKKEKSSRKREASLKLLAQAQAQAHDLNQRGGIYDGMETASQKSRSAFHMNQKARMYNENEVSIHNSSPIFNQKERVYRGHEAAANRNMTPVFDLNEISREEEELQAGLEPPRMEEEPINSFLRSENDAKNSDLMISPMCRNVGNGSNRAGKRKISWQDQVALRA